MGNVPTDNKVLMKSIETAIGRGVIVVIKTQCHHGKVHDAYETGRLLVQLGCILGLDMTVECIFAKLSYLIGKGYSTKKIISMMKTNMRGELTDFGRAKDKYSLKNNKMVMAIADTLKVSDFDDMQQINKTITPVLINSVVSTVSSASRV